ncbi:Diacylglycerol kinase [Handroanthus impetiginosus]|uniref:Diacylglycerol kinase n=1 Tax=Handroanthus impetiginosus TaxID=429701 RepID=A0A2G9G2Z4_9LAMI|nr:Diacylglycerol kinase [Handroanthus impetiginosus]
MQMRVRKEGSREPIAPLELPHALHLFHQVSSTDDLSVEGYHTFCGGFWKLFQHGFYFAKTCIINTTLFSAATLVSICGRMDAQVSFAFHSERKLHPEKFKNQMIIQPFVDSGLLEVVGFKDAWHGLALLAPNGASCTACPIFSIHPDLHRSDCSVCKYAHDIRFELHKGGAENTYMRIDGEPWRQPLPVDDDIVVVEISHFGQVKMLATPDCRSKNVLDPLSPITQNDKRDNECDDEPVGEERRKFGAADTEDS